jgi:hypothetical protein
LPLVLGSLAEIAVVAGVVSRIIRVLHLGNGKSS